MPLSVSDLTGRGNLGAHYATTTLGYDSVTFSAVELKPDGSIHYVYFLTDDFQKDLPLDQRYQHGYVTIEFPSLDNVSDNPLNSYDNRAVRELKVLARQCAGISGMESKLVNLEARIFVEALKTSVADLARQIEGPKA